MSKITYRQYKELLLKEELTDEEILEYSRVVKGHHGFQFYLEPNPQKVEMTSEDLQYEDAMQIGGYLAKHIRKIRFFRKKKLFGSNKPVLVSEGDSWFQFPFLIKEVIDHLNKDYLIWSLGEAGDTAENMVKGKEYMKGLLKHKKDVRGFLLSAAGNDIIGEDPDTGKAALFDILKDFNGDTMDVFGHINHGVLGEKLFFLRQAYSMVISNIRNEPGLEELPIFVHGYDYVFPYPDNDNDPRNPSYAKKDEWLGEPLAGRKIHDRNLRRNIVMKLIDTLYDMLFDLAGDSKQSNIWVVDCRRTMPNLSDWNDEIHGTSEGFAKVAAKFRAVINGAI